MDKLFNISLIAEGAHSESLIPICTNILRLLSFTLRWNEWIPIEIQRRRVSAENLSLILGIAGQRSYCSGSRLLGLPKSKYEERVESVYQFKYEKLTKVKDKTDKKM